MSSRHAFATALLAFAVTSHAHVLPCRAQSDEATREIATGGLAFVNDPAIIVEQAELQIGIDEIKVAYALRNVASVPRTILVTFALPDLDMAAIGDQAVKLAAPQSANFVAATFVVDGTPVAAEFEQRATAFGLDVTRLLDEARVPLFPLAKGSSDRLGRLSPAQKLDFHQRGILRSEGAKAEANWTLRTTGHWRQSFAPQQVLTMQLAYRPIAATARYSSSIIDAHRASHCIDAVTETAITQLVAATGGNATFRWLSYNLTAGSAYLSGPLARFRMLIEKPRIDAVVATCRKGLRRPGPLTLEWSAETFAPDEDIAVLFVQ